MRAGLLRSIAVAAASLVLVLCTGCGGEGKRAHGSPLDPEPPDAGSPESPGTPDGGVGLPDGGEPDAGNPGFQFGTPGPWPLAPVTRFGSAQGLVESQIIEASTDEAQNIWAVSHEALYLLRPGETTFRRYGQADGLHLDLALPPGITAVVGGAPGEAWIGYKGASVVDPQKDPERHLGKLDRVLLRPDGTLAVTRYDVHNDDYAVRDASGELIDSDFSFYEDRTVYRFLYDHRFHRGTLYVGFNHGVSRFDPDRPDPTSGLEYADHIHPVAINSSGTQRMGEWRALALDPLPRLHPVSGAPIAGGLWMGGRWAAGMSLWTPVLYDWARNEQNPFWIALRNPPVFPVASGEDVYFTGIAPLSDGTVYFASGPMNWGFSPLGIAFWRAWHTTLVSPTAIGLPSWDILQMEALPDDTLLFLLPEGLFRWNPKPAPNGTMLGKVSGLPSGLGRIYVDWMVKPTAVYLASQSGFALVRLPEAETLP